jgi:hypothetical protein
MPLTLNAPTKMCPATALDSNPLQSHRDGADTHSNGANFDQMDTVNFAPFACELHILM